MTISQKSQTAEGTNCFEIIIYIYVIIIYENLKIQTRAQRNAIGISFHSKQEDLICQAVIQKLDFNSG